MYSSLAHSYARAQRMPCAENAGANNTRRAIGDIAHIVGVSTHLRVISAKRTMRLCARVVRLHLRAKITKNGTAVLNQ